MRPGAKASPLKYKYRRISFELFVMSQCPDAAFCQNHFKKLIKGPLAPIIDFKQHFIAYPNNKEFTCPHGPPECEGNMMQVCAQVYYPDNWFDFVLCQSGDMAAIPGNGPRCATSLGMEWALIDKCRNGDEGKALMTKSVERTQSFGITKSCTLYINNEFFCLRDGGAWRSGCKASDLSSITEEICGVASMYNSNAALEGPCRMDTSAGQG